MPPSPDYRRRRAAVIALGALMLVSGGHRTPMIGTLSISIDRQSAQIDADWTPPVALAIAGVGQAATAIGTLFQR
ncbi:hypothetical protein [Sphingomonas phyllosphaerae]|uniref:hypothetical protein n=1 Tax=Sphingomonas phyllosphaerae TaxID=257003 RepID=UPI00040339B4|nr:hypothetical protein [Sphingomonas phyllosphaerae]